MMNVVICLATSFSFVGESPTLYNLCQQEIVCNDTFAMRPQAIYYSTGFQHYSTVMAVFVDMCAKCKFHLEKALPVVACYLNYTVRSSYIFMMKR